MSTDTKQPAGQTVRDELRDQVSRMECDRDYKDIWKDSVAAARVHEAMRLHDLAVVSVLEEVENNITNASYTNTPYETDRVDIKEAYDILDAAIAKYKEPTTHEQ